MEMAPLEKNTSQSATLAASKAKSPADRGVGPADDHPPHPNVLIEDAGEGQSFPPTDLREEENGHEAQLPTEGKFLHRCSLVSRSR